MSSSDSDDDCYGNIAQKLQSIKSTYKEEKVQSVLNDTFEVGETSTRCTIIEENGSENIVEDCNVTVNSINSADNDEFTLDAIIANNSKRKPTRGRGRGRGRGAKRKSTEESPEAAERVTRTSKRKTSNSTRGRTSSVTNASRNPEPGLETASVEENTIGANRRGSTRGRGSRGRNRGAAGSTASPRSRRRGSRRQHIFEFFNLISQSILPTSSYPTYSVGNTDEYPDQCDNQQLFATRTVNNDVEVIEDVDPLEEDNEEMSVKVYWQSLEVFKFKIRKYQKLTQIFDYFTEKEGVSNDKLLFTYNDRILKIDDTPDSINYSIAKFIDGGVVNQNVTELIKEKDKQIVNNGLKIKFQCQNKKKPFETTLRPEDKLALAMMKCAEHFETPLERLKFYFDGDLISNKSTPEELELEGGECIDVKICS